MRYAAADSSRKPFAFDIQSVMMSQSVRAIFENGILRPLQPLQLAENARVAITVVSDSESWIDEDAHAAAGLDCEDIPLETVRSLLSPIKGDFADDVIRERGDY